MPNYVRLASNVGGESYNIADYGAVSGGSATTNTTALQNAINAADAAGGGRVFVPTGSFTINQILLKSKVTLEGTGWGSSLTCNNNLTGGAMIALDSTSVQYTRIRRLFLNGNKAGQTSQTPSGILLTGVSGNPNHLIEDCFIYQFKNHGIELTTSQHTRMVHNWIYGCDGCGIYADYPDQEIEANKVANSGLECIFLDDGASNTHLQSNQVWAAGQVDGARGDGIRIGCSQVQSINDESADNKRHGWNIDGGYYAVIRTHVQDNNASGTGGAAIRCRGAGGHHIDARIGGGSRSVHSSLLQFDTDGSAYPHNCFIRISYSSASIGANPETVGTIASDNFIQIFNRVSSGNFQFDDAQNIVLGTSTGTKIGTGTTQKLSFYNATPVVRPSTTGETTGFTAGAGTAVNDASTFTGNVGSTAYRINDIVKHLKNLGLIAS